MEWRLTGVHFSSGIHHLTEAHQQTTDGARGADAARNKNCQPQFHPGGAPVDSPRTITLVNKREKFAGTASVIQTGKTAETNNETLFT
jgi:hypothetical protein